MLVVVPLESYDTRYTEQWNRWFPRYLDGIGIPYRYLTANVDYDEPAPGEVLDAFGTTSYKLDQLRQIVAMLKSGELTHGDVLFFHTLWFPGIDSLQYLRQALRIDFKIVGVLHTGTYDPWDFRSRIGMGSWAASLENSWFTFVDRVFVATHFHRDMVCGARKLPREKVFVTSLPLDVAELRQTVGEVPRVRDRLVAFPHRDVPEKDPQVLERIEAHVRDARIVRTRDVTTTKADYLKLLARSPVTISSSLQETFGYSMLEAAAVGSVPIVPDRLCYVELYPAQFRYATDTQLVQLVNHYLDNWADPADAMAETFAKAEASIATMVDLAVNW